MLGRGQQTPMKSQRVNSLDCRPYGLSQLFNSVVAQKQSQTTHKQMWLCSDTALFMDTGI